MYRIGVIYCLICLFMLYSQFHVILILTKINTKGIPMKTRHFPSLLSLITASLLLAACGSSDPGTASATDTAEQTAPAAADTAVTETTVDPR